MSNTTRAKINKFLTDKGLEEYAPKDFIIIKNYSDDDINVKFESDRVL